MKILRASKEDLRSILDLQYIAYQSEARLLDNFNIQPLTETLEELEEEYNNGKIYKAVTEENMIVGSVRCVIKTGTVYIGKLMVLPEYQKNGIGTELLRFIEEDNKGLRRELFTSDRSINNLKLYERNGYVRFRTEPASKDFNLVYLEKK